MDTPPHTGAGRCGAHADEWREAAKGNARRYSRRVGFVAVPLDRVEWLPADTSPEAAT